ncbi:MAG: helix-turn-helix domain-containing protein [Clostridiales bacterium]|nr:helix-turn-helix domain-containing protein [Clostridiales bacterium]
MKKGKRTNKKYSPKFKLSVILDMRNNHLGYKETMRKYRITGCESISKWERKYLEESIAGLEKENRGRPTINGKKRGRPVKLDNQVEEDLIAENQRLRMEIEYLKKLSALVLAEEQKNGKKPKLKTFPPHFFIIKSSNSWPKRNNL